MNTYDSIISFSPSELELLLAGYEERLQKNRENNKQKRRYNADLTLEETADLIEQKKKEDLDAVIHNIKNNFSNNEVGVKRFKRDTSDDDEEEDKEEDDKKIVTVKQKFEDFIQRYSLQSYNGTDAIPEDFTHSDFEFDDCTADDFAPQDLLPPDAPVFDYSTDNEVPDYLQPPALPCVKTKQITRSPDQKY
jgi:hypothetical protein